MRFGINHQIIESSDRAFYGAWFDAVKTWAKVFRLGSHMDAYAWRVDPFHVYSDGQKPMDSFHALGQRCVTAKIDIDFIRDGASSSPDWRALGGDWSTFDNDNWRDDALPKEAWTKTTVWLNEAAKALNKKGILLRFQAANEQFGRGKDQYAYQRLKSVYTGASYGKQWSSPALWGPRPQLIAMINEWLTMRKYDSAFSKASFLCLNVYPDWTPGVTVDTASNLMRQIENFVIVSDMASKAGLGLTISEFGFAKNQVPEGEAERCRITAVAMRAMEVIGGIDTATLYWDSGDYYISPDGLKSLAGLLKSQDVLEEAKKLVDIARKALSIGAAGAVQSKA